MGRKQSASIKIGGNLTTINDASENQWIVDNFGFQNSLPVIDDFQMIHQKLGHIGLDLQTKKIKENWEWISGEDSTYTNWGPGST